MNKEQQELLDEVFENYRKIVWRITNMPLYTKEEFINKCKTDSEFSEKWGLKIEERELNVDELNIVNLLKQTSTKLITITYNDKTIESYE
jgi:DNA polymerase III delta subunit